MIVSVEGLPKHPDSTSLLFIVQNEIQTVRKKNKMRTIIILRIRSRDFALDIYFKSFSCIISMNYKVEMKDGQTNFCRGLKVPNCETMHHRPNIILNIINENIFFLTKLFCLMMRIKAYNFIWMIQYRPCKWRQM